MRAESGRSLAPGFSAAFLAARLRDYLALTKPGIAFTVVFTTFAGFWLGLRAGGASFHWDVLLHTLLGTALVAAGAGTLNMLLEVESDSLMERTRHRPLAAGRIFPEEAFLVGTLAASLGLVHLGMMVSPRAAFLAALSLMVYLVLYTPLKKRSAFCTLVGAFSGALPPLIGWTASSGALSAGAFSTFAILFVWQFPHLFALSWMYREDYAKAQFKMFPLQDLYGKRTAALTIASSLLLLATALLPWKLGLAGAVYAWLSLLPAAGILGFSIAFSLRRTRRRASFLFFSTLFYLPLLYGFLVLFR